MGTAGLRFCGSPDAQLRKAEDLCVSYVPLLPRKLNGMAPKIRDLSRREYEAWDSFVLARPAGTFFHKAGWREVIEAAFRHKSHYILAEQDGSVTGVLPLFHIRSLLFGNRLVSVPFCVYGGPLAVDDATAQALRNSAIDLMNRVGANLIEFRLRNAEAFDWVTRSDLYATFRKELHSEPEQNLKAIPRKQRAVVRKAIGLGLQASFSRDVTGFYRLYSESVRNLGTPVFSQRYLQLLIDKFREDTEILTVTEQEKTVASVLSFFFRDEVIPYYGAGKPRARDLGAFDFMYWQVMNHAASARDSRIFDFGRSKVGTGPFAFKKNWGFTPQPLHYAYWLTRGHQIPNNNPLNPKYKIFIENWKRLPLPIANRVGPFIARGIG